MAAGATTIKQSISGTLDPMIFKANPRPVRTIICIIVCILVILSASGQIANWQPFGIGAMVRSAFSLLGITGAVLLLCRRRVAWFLLLPWAVLQTIVYIRDPSGAWFYQSISAGWQNTNSVFNNDELTRLRGSGFNFAGVLWLVIFTVMLVGRVFPPLRPLAGPFRVTRPKAVALSLIVAVLLAWLIYRDYEQRHALLVLSTNYPGTHIYYQDQYLGRTPLAMTADKIKEWNLPLDSSQPLNISSTNYTQRIVVYSEDHQSKVVLDAKSPFYAPSPKPLPTPWGIRHTILEGGTYQGRRLPMVLRNETSQTLPQLYIELLQPPPYTTGQIVPLSCTFTSPSKRLEGDNPQIRVILKSFTKPSIISNTSKPIDWDHNLFDMPASWAAWPVGQSRTEIVEFQMPDQPGHYTLMAVFNLFKKGNSRFLVIGSPYSEYLLVKVVESSNTDDHIP